MQKRRSSSYLSISGKNYYPQVFLEEFKYIVKEKIWTKYTNEVLEISSDSVESVED